MQKFKLLTSQLTYEKLICKTGFNTKQNSFDTHTHTHKHAALFYPLCIHSFISAMKGEGGSKSMLENVPFQLHQGVPHGFCDCARRRALTSLEEKIKVCERPDRLGSATNPEISVLGLAGLESSMTEKLWNKWKQGTHLLK